MLAGWNTPVLDPGVTLKGVPMLHTPATAVDILLAGLIDYAGLYPPANLDMRPAVDNYLRYRQGRHEHMLGRFIVDLSRADELRATAGDDLAELRVSVLAPPNPDLSQVSSVFAAGLPIEAIEFKYASPEDVKSLIESVPRGVETSTLSPLPLPISARASGELTESRPPLTSASSSPPMRKVCSS